MSKTMYWHNAPVRATKRTVVMESTEEISMDNEIQTSTDEISDQPEPESYTYKFSCAMLPLTDQSASIVKYWTQVNVSPDDIYVNPDEGFDGYENDPHVTVKYGIHDIEPNELASLLKGCGAVTLQFGNVTCFDTNPAFDVIKIDVISPKLMKINELISNSMQCTDTYPEYRPHVTLAYVKKGACSHLIGNDFFNKLTDTLSEMQFASRNGEDYWIDL